MQCTINILHSMHYMLVAMAFENGALSRRAVWKRGTEHLRESDPVMARIISGASLKELELESDYYRAIVESIVFQQLAGKAAEAILKRFKGLYNGRLPTPRQFLSAEESFIRNAGISPQKYSYITDLCLKLENGLVELESLGKKPDEEVIAELTKVKGIGRWTAEMFLMFSLGRPDVFAMDDLGLRNAVIKAYRLRKQPSKEKLAAISRKWKPYRSIASLYLWRYKDTTVIRAAKEK